MSSMKRSSVSILSRITCDVEEEPNYEDMNDEELKESLEVAIRSNKIITLENEIFTRFLSRHDPQSLVPMPQMLENAKLLNSHVVQSTPRFDTWDSIFGLNLWRDNTPPSPTTSASSLHTVTTSRGFASSLTNATRSSPKGFRITLSYRIEMVNKEIEEMKKQLETLEKQSINKKADLIARIQEIQLRIRDINEARKEFEENVVKKGVDPLTGKIATEKFVKFIEMWLKTADRIIDKLRLKTSTIKTQIKRKKVELQQRKELGETIHLIDFQALAIENHDYSEKIQQKTREITELKKITGHYNLKLNNHKVKLTKQQAILSEIEKEMTTKRNQIEKLTVDLENIRRQLEKMTRQMTHISTVMNEYQSPDVLDFIKLQTELEEMKTIYKRIVRHKNMQISALKEKTVKTINT